MSFDLRPARPEDVGELLALIRDLAVFEELTHLLEVDEERLAAGLFGPRPHAEAILAWPRSGSARAAGFALYFHNFSTFLGKPGLYLEDLFVRPEARRQGCATALLRELAGIAIARGCGRFEWSVLDWNVDAQAFYAKIGANLLPDWRITRMTGDALATFAAATD